MQNLRDETEVKTESAAMAINKEMQTRYLHPQWIKAQQAEGYSGTLQVLKTSNFLWGWQVTAPQEVRQDHWQSLHNVYVRDQYKLGTRQWLEGDNRAAFAQTLERMLDAVRLNYWKPDDATRQELAQAYTEALKATGLRESNPQVQRFAAQQMQTPKQDSNAAQANAQAKAAPSAATPRVQPPQPSPNSNPKSDRFGEQVQGLKLEPQPQAAIKSDTPASVVESLAALLGISVLLAVGAWRQLRLTRQTRHTRGTPSTSNKLVKP